MSRGLSAKQIEILQVLAHGEGTATDLVGFYAVRREDLFERPHQLLKRTKRALASLERRGLVAIVGPDEPGFPRCQTWRQIGSTRFSTREKTVARITDEGRAALLLLKMGCKSAPSEFRATASHGHGGDEHFPEICRKSAGAAQGISSRSHRSFDFLCGRAA
jgi:hypothetical protein